MPHKHKYILRDLVPKYKQKREPGRKCLVYQCVGCSHNVSLQLSLGREFECGNCGEVGRITSKHISRRIVRPKCENCSGGRGFSSEVSLDDVLGEL